MVFYGRPSKDCAPCRKRKTRCDLVSTGCSQCRRAKVTCHGYRNANDLVFRDETKNIVQKALARQTASQLPSAPQFSSDVSSRHAFLSLYAGTYTCAYDALQSLLAESAPNWHLQVSVDAAGLAFMAFQLNRQELIPLAERRYLAAIRAIGMVVRSSMHMLHDTSDLSLSDATLQSVLLLDLCEKMAYQYRRQSQSAGLQLSHVQGALAIVRSRPRSKFCNSTIQRLAIQSFYACILSCGTSKIAIPEASIGLYNELGSYLPDGEYALMGLLIRLVNFRADMRNDKSDPSDILKRARDLYNMFSDIENKMPHSWRPRRKDTCDTAAFHRYYDVYPHRQASQILNTCRSMRIDLAEVIQKFQPCAEVAEAISQACQAICDSVPELIIPAARSHNTIPLSLLQILECSAVLSPLYSVARNAQNPRMHAWILQTLTYMADSGVKLAQTVAHIILFEPQMDHWDVFGVIGNYSVASFK
ncbi:hypothetical protein LB506_012795 [Fusarium annulatum]|nr:hypothetical protein LB506_012795 [Fusarium annulatum]